uniref:Integrator complex subunit 15 n=1 Tax=Oncorhynchus kisutch TaxID=8019 RepID=A0A8C7L796_ONCKI
MCFRCCTIWISTCLARFRITLPSVDTPTLELVEEFILHRRMSALQELQLLEIMCSCFQEQSRDAVRQLIFSALFTLQGNQADESRMALLGKLVSMAIAVSRVPILECAATWLQRSHPVYCRRLARVLVDDYCSLLPGSMVPTLNNLSCSCPPFCCQFITAVTTLYDLSTEELTPPVQLLQMVVSWIQDQPRLVLITLLNTPPSSSQPIGSLDLTPLAGLVRWCVKAPLAYRRDGKQDLANGMTETELEAGPLFSELHLSVLQVLLLLPGVLREKGLLGRLALLQPDQLTSLISDLSGLLEELNPLHSDTQTHIQLTLDRLAQALQVSMAAGALLCSRGRDVISCVFYSCDVLCLLQSYPVCSLHRGPESSLFPPPTQQVRTSHSVPLALPTTNHNVPLALPTTNHNAPLNLPHNQSQCTPKPSPQPVTMHP